MTVSDLASLYDARYYRTYRGASYERSDLWLTQFRAMAHGIVQELQPGSVLEVGCAIGMLVEALRNEGVEAYGLDISTYAIEQVPDDFKAYCWVGSVLDPQPRRYDLAVCYEVLEHLPPEAADGAVSALCQLADDILFSSSPDDFNEDTHLNVRPAEYWAGLFAQHGFVRDVDFDPLGVMHLPAVRFRRTAEPLHRIVANFERRMSRLVQENVALRLRALETKALLTEQERAHAEQPCSHADVAALELTIAEQSMHLEAQTERLMYMSDREGDLRTLLHDAHEQLLQRDEGMTPLRQELDARGAVIEELDRAVKDRTAWAERMVAEAEARGAIINDLQRSLDELRRQPAASVGTVSQEDGGAELKRLVEERTAWGQQLAVEAEARGHVIDDLQRLVDERTAWAERMVAEAEERGRIIDDLQHLVDEHAASAQRLAQETGQQQRTITELERLVDERTAWAERMVAEAEARGRILDDLGQVVEERDKDIQALRRSARKRPAVSREAEALAARIDTPPVRLFVRGYRRVRRLV